MMRRDPPGRRYLAMTRLCLCVYLFNNLAINLFSGALHSFGWIGFCWPRGQVGSPRTDSLIQTLVGQSRVHRCVAFYHSWLL
jgi:hypothetical protein